MAGKTQVFTRLGAESDHSRSRLTHTLEVAQIARTAAGTMGLNSLLAEALALVHDIGHPPFGHAGEKALDGALRTYGLRFDHNLHALRIVTHFEERYAGFPGLNLTFAAREGIIKHSRDYSVAEHPELGEYLLPRQAPLEAQLIDLADEIAYLTADIEDGLAAGILELGSLRDGIPFFAKAYANAEQRYPGVGSTLLSNEALKAMLNQLATDLMMTTALSAREAGVKTLEDVRRHPGRLVRLSTEMEERRAETKAFLYAHLYNAPEMRVGHARAAEVIEQLFAAWVQEPERMPADHLARVEAEGAPRAVADYIAGMTDAYIEKAWEQFLAAEA
ncbi:MAG TPA: HD domain-containing protein [Acidobacteriaceae bacterium]